jgi:hypothetical protein
MVERRELGDKPNEERRELDKESPAWPETRAQRGVPSVAGDVVKRRELGDDPNEE